MELNGHVARRSGDAIESDRSRAHGPRTTLSLLDPKLQKRLLALHSATDPDEFLKSAVQLIAAVIPCDMVLSQVRRVGGDGSRGQTTFWDRRSAVLRREEGWPCLVGDRFLSILAACPGEAAPFPADGSREQPGRFPFFVSSVQGIAMRSAVGLFFWNEAKDVVDLLLAPHRGFRLPRVSGAEMAAVQALHPHIEAAHQRVRRTQADTRLRRDLERFISTLPLPTILLDSEFTLIYNNSAGRRAVALWSGSDPQIKLTRQEFRMPAELLSVLAEMRRGRASHPSPVPRERLVRHPRRPDLKARLSLRHGCRSDGEGDRFVVQFETDRLGRSEKLATLTRLSPRERELALMVNEGKSNQEIADALGRQLNTVKSELHSVFRKLEIPSRARLIALLR